jgi:hypothetical protein
VVGSDFFGGEFSTILHKKKMELKKKKTLDLKYSS